jgi:hypothetical protein
MRARACYQVVELRQYTLGPGMRHLLIGLFEQEFSEKVDLVKRTEFCRMPSRDRMTGIRATKSWSGFLAHVESCVAASRLGSGPGKST